MANNKETLGYKIKQWLFPAVFVVITLLSFVVLSVSLYTVVWPDIAVHSATAGQQRKVNLQDLTLTQKMSKGDLSNDSKLSFDQQVKLANKKIDANAKAAKARIAKQVIKSKHAVIDRLKKVADTRLAEANASANRAEQGKWDLSVFVAEGKNIAPNIRDDAKRAYVERLKKLHRYDKSVVVPKLPPERQTTDGRVAGIQREVNDLKKWQTKQIGLGNEVASNHKQLQNLRQHVVRNTTAISSAAVKQKAEFVALEQRIVAFQKQTSKQLDQFTVKKTALTSLQKEVSIAWSQDGYLQLRHHILRLSMKLDGNTLSYEELEHGKSQEETIVVSQPLFVSLPYYPGNIPAYRVYKYDSKGIVVPVAVNVNPFQFFVPYSGNGVSLWFKSDTYQVAPVIVRGATKYEVTKGL